MPETNEHLIDLDEVAEPVERIRRLRDALDEAFIERAGEVDALILGLVAGEHVLLLGPPGTAKSMLARALCDALSGARFFSRLLTRFSVIEEVFGPVSLKGLEQDRYRRVTDGYLPEAHVAFLDEIFKANSAILNALLTAINERLFDEGGQQRPIPLELVVGASNELPQDDVLDALFDRFLLRRWVSPIKDRDEMRSLLMTSKQPSIGVRVSMEDVLTVRAAADRVDVEPVVDAVVDLRDSLARSRGIEASDRRWRKCMSLVRARAVLDGRAAARKSDLMVLGDALWRDPDDRPAVQSAIAEAAAPELAQAMRLFDAAGELHDDLSPDADGRALAAANRELKRIAKEIGELVDDDETGDVRPLRTQVTKMQRGVARRAARKLGLDD